MNKLYVANLKMNLSYKEALDYKKVLDSYIINNLVICPSFIHLDVMKSDNYILGAQDGFYINKGPFTGQVSFYQLKDMGVKYCIIGHSEFRKVYNESPYIINKKVKSCLENNIIPIICVGESIEQKNKDETLSIIEQDLKIILEDIKINDIIISYEPIWSIGSNIIPSETEIEETHMYIKKLLKDTYNINANVLYGGSVNVQNITNIININGVDGVLIGTAAEDPNTLIQTISKVNM